LAKVYSAARADVKQIAQAEVVGELTAIHEKGAGNGRRSAR